jgi:hypothetical protein
MNDEYVALCDSKRQFVEAIKGFLGTRHSIWPHLDALCAVRR